MNIDRLVTVDAPAKLCMHRSSPTLVKALVASVVAKQQ